VTTTELQRTTLYDLHLARGGRMGAFAGYEMPLRYQAGPMAEHLHCRAAAALFDVSHMAIVDVTGPGAAAALESVVPAPVATLPRHRAKYTFFLDASAGILDDLMVTPRSDDDVSMVLNAATAGADLDLLAAALPAALEVRRRTDLALVALQGPAAVAVLARHDPAVAALTFMEAGTARVAGHTVSLSRSGYTGEDGFEIALPAADAADICAALLDEPEVEPAGLAARDSLRLEAGMCLYGHDLDPSVDPVEAGLLWAVPKSRRTAEAGYPGAAALAAAIEAGPARRRVGLRPVGRKPVREGATLSVDGERVGAVTSGGFGPSVDGPVAMGYVATPHAGAGTEVQADVRGTAVACVVEPLPFVPHRYVR
jgi:aminomethyltransferase